MIGKFVFSFVSVLAALGCALATDYATPGATFEAKDFTEWSLKMGDSSKASINVPFTAADGSSDFVAIQRLDLVGTDRERGYAHGYLMAKEILEFQGPKLDQYFRQMVLGVDVDTSSMPEPLQKILHVIKVKGALAAPAAFRAALNWVWEKEKAYVPSYILEEMAGMGEGLCDRLNKGVVSPDCVAADWTASIQQLNMLPELIRMACTAYGAWGKATATGEGLIQLRALDFGGGPFANYTIAAVYRDSLEPAADANAFVSITFPGFAGVITGVSQAGIGVSEKVWMTYDKYSLQPGSYDGEADIFVLRDILQQSRNRKDAEQYLMHANRTWGIFVGIGDYETNVFDLVAYQQSGVGAYTDVTMPTVTGQPYLESIAYVDKHPQPSHDGAEGTLPTALSDFWGNISLETSKTITQYHETGDLHIASYDFGAKDMYMAVGRVNSKGDYMPTGGEDSSEWKAYNRPYLKFSMADLWAGL